MKRWFKSLITFITFLVLTMNSGTSLAQEQNLMVFAGAASKPPLEEAAKAFEKKTGVKVDLIFGGSGIVLSQMILTKKGDIYFPGSSDYMELAKEKGVVYPETERIVVYLVPAINVPRGNPKNIKSLKDLAKPGVRVAIANPDGVCVGGYAVEIIEKNFTPKEKAQFRKNLVNYLESCEKTATAVALGTVDAVVGWEVFEHWNPQRIQTIKLKPSEIVRIGYIPIAVSKFTKNRELAEKFINFIRSDEGKAIFRKYGYLMAPEEAFAFVGEKKPIGGKYVVPREWIKK